MMNTVGRMMDTVLQYSTSPVSVDSWLNDPPYLRVKIMRVLELKKARPYLMSISVFLQG